MLGLERGVDAFEDVVEAVCVYKCGTGLWRGLEAVPGPLDGRARC